MMKEKEGSDWRPLSEGVNSAFGWVCRAVHGGLLIGMSVALPVRVAKIFLGRGFLRFPSVTCSRSGRFQNEGAAISEVYFPGVPGRAGTLVWVDGSTE